SCEGSAFGAACAPCIPCALTGRSTRTRRYASSHGRAAVAARQLPWIVRPLSAMATFRILSWSAERAWTGSTTYYRARLIQRLRSANPNMARLDAKRLARRILDREESEFSIASDRHIQSLRLFLESSGAEVEVICATSAA